MIKFKVIVLCVRDGLVILDNVDDIAYAGWTTKTPEEQQALLSARGKIPSMGYGNMPETLYRKMFQLSEEDRIEPGTVKMFVAQVPPDLTISPVSYNDSVDIIH